MHDSNSFRCLIVEDEPIAADVLKDYIEQVPMLQLKGICTDAIFAMDRLKTESIDVIFLDIHLPKLKGLDFLRILRNPPQVILTTAYHQYALDAFEEDVVDYLMKPIEFSRFLRAVHKLKPVRASITNTSAQASQRAFAFFNVNKKMVKVFLDEILYVESLKDYSRIVTTDAQLVTRGQIGEMEATLGAPCFLRVHRSYIANLDQILSYSASEVELPQKTLPIGRSFKERVATRIRRHFGLN